MSIRSMLTIASTSFLLLAMVVGALTKLQQSREFRSDREIHMTSIRRLIDAGDVERAEEYLSQFSLVNDIDLDRMRADLSRLKRKKEFEQTIAAMDSSDAETRLNAAHKVHLIDQNNEKAKSIIVEDIAKKAYFAGSVGDYAGQVVYIKAILRLQPGNPKWERMLIDAEYMEFKAAQKQVTERIVKPQFDADGSHRGLVAATKKRMHNADSFQHIATSHEVVNGKLIIEMSFRGTNGFGAVVKNTVIAVAREDGSDLTIVYPE